MSGNQMKPTKVNPWSSHSDPDYGGIIGPWTYDFKPISQRKKVGIHGKICKLKRSNGESLLKVQLQGSQLALLRVLICSYHILSSWGETTGNEKTTMPSWIVIAQYTTPWKQKDRDFSNHSMYRTLNFLDVSEMNRSWNFTWNFTWNDKKAWFFLYFQSHAICL